FDGAHNAGGAEVLARYLQTLAVRDVRWVVGLKGDKRIDDILVPLRPHCTALYCTTAPVDAPCAPAALAKAAGGLPATVFAAPTAALEAALADRPPDGIVLVAGSLFLVGALRHYLSTGRPRALA
ncbi:MAG: hypothetical protein IH614_16735, partial [Desulfuromonadales bacterium]|nr:hypothetical protein [Desulfuromonadales bacterium]